MKNNNTINNKLAFTTRTFHLPEMENLSLSQRKAQEEKDLAAFLEMAKKAEKLAIETAKEEARFALGADFEKALMQYKKDARISIMTAEDYDYMVSYFHTLSVLAAKLPLDMTTDEIVQLLEERCNIPHNPDMTEEEKLEFIRFMVDRYIEENVTTSHTKATYTIVKMSLEDIVLGEDGKLVFDSSKAMDLSGSVIKARTSNSTMRKVKTSEDGLYRTIKKRKCEAYYEATYKACVEKGMTEEQAKYEAMGLPMVSIDLNIPYDANKEWMKFFKTQLFKDGVTDVATGYHYLFLKATPSETRTGCATFVYAETWDDVHKLWYEFTGLGSYEAFRDAFDTDKGVNIVKMLARFSSRGSNSHPTMELYDETHAEAIKNTRILFVPDPEFVLARAQKEASKDDSAIITFNENGSAKLKPGDGQALFSNRYCALNAGGMKLISANEEASYFNTWEKCHHDINKARKNSSFRRIESRIPAVWQIRGGVANMQSLKGIGVKCFFEHIKVTLTAEVAEGLNKLNGTTFAEGDILNLGNYDIICPKSVAKFMIKNEAASSEFNLEICNYLKKKGEWVCLNPQFIAALNPENPNKLNPIVKFWGKEIREAFDDISKMQRLMNIVSYTNDIEELVYDDIIDDDKQTIETADLSEILIANRKLASDPQVLNMIKDKLEKFVREMRVGRLRVPGMYTYMVQDPWSMLNRYFGLKLPCLQSGQFYFNNKDCQAGLFRSPLIAPFEAQKVQLEKSALYWAYKDVVVFNTYDGTWDLMGGADFDGDTCAVVTNDDRNGFGELVVSSIRDGELPLYAEGKSAKEVKWSPDYQDELIEYLCTIARDNTGVFTNYATRLLDLSNHFRGVKYFAVHNKCETVEFINPEAFGERHARYGKYGMNFQCVVHGNTFQVRGIVPCAWNKDLGKHVFDVNHPGAVVGKFTLAQMDELSNNFMKLVEVLRVIIGEEIDGAKTGYHPAVPAEYQCKMNPHWFMTRQCFLNRVDRVYKKDNNGNPTDKIVDEPTQYNVVGMLDTIDMPKYKQYNVFYSFSMMGRIHDLTWQIMYEDIMPRFTQGTSKLSLLKSLMTDEERNALSIVSNKLDKDGKNMTLLQVIAERKAEYNQSLHNAKQIKLSEEDSKKTTANLKYLEAQELARLAKAFNVSLETIACGAYLATYDKDSNQNNGLSYAWILWTELISVFSRDNASFELFKLPDTATKAHVENGVLYVDDKKFMPVKAMDGEVLIQHFGGTKAFGLLHKDKGVSVTAAPVRVSAGAVYEIGVYGFGHANREAKSVADWERIMKNVCNMDFYILPDKDGALCTAYIDAEGNQHNLGQLMLDNQSTSNVDIELRGKKVHITTSPNYCTVTQKGEPAKTIKGLRVRVIG